MKSDVTIIGGGIIGICTAYYLLKRGRAVTLLERGEICSGSSYGNAGLIVPGHSMPLSAPGVVASAPLATPNDSARAMRRPQV